jgi:hypothetical protein
MSSTICYDFIAKLFYLLIATKYLLHAILLCLYKQRNNFEDSEEINNPSLSSILKERKNVTYPANDTFCQLESQKKNDRIEDLERT